MLKFTQLALSGEHAADSIREAAADLTARRARRQDAAHDSLARSAESA
jgi:hypothetical protein